MKAQEQGFTLLELLTVMAIMMMLMGMSVAAYYGLMRSGGIDGAVMDVRASLNLARQYAVTHRCRTHVLFWQDGTNAYHQVCVEEGRHVGASGEDLTIPQIDRWANGALVGSEVYNLSANPPRYGPVEWNTTFQLAASNRIDGGTLTWFRNDGYGWALRSQSRLPDGVAFGAGEPQDAPDSVVFLSDGTTAMAHSGAGYEIVIKELYGSEANKITKTVTVNALTGSTKVQDL